MYNFLLKFKVAIKFNGWAITLATIFFFVANKTVLPEYLIEFWIAFVFLHLVTLSWVVAAFRFPEYRKKAIVSVLVPYISGSVIWLGLFLALWALVVINK